MDDNKERKEKINKVTSSELRVYKDGCRPSIFKDKRKQKKHKKTIDQEYEKEYGKQTEEGN